MHVSLRELVIKKEEKNLVQILKEVNVVQVCGSGQQGELT